METTSQVPEPLEITPAYCCGCYWFAFFIVALPFPGIISNMIDVEGCYLELFANSISLSNATNANANVSTADWRIGFLAKSPVTNCKISLHTIKSRLLRGDVVISQSSPLDFSGQLVSSDKTDGPVTSVGFKNVVTPGVIGGVFSDFRVEIVSGVKRNDKGKNGDGFLTVFCGDLPVKFSADSAGNMVGSLLGNMRRCNFVFHGWIPG